MTDKVDDARHLVIRINNLAQRLEAIADQAAFAGVALLDGLNKHAANKSVSTLEALCDDVEGRVQRVHQIRAV